VCCVTNGYLTPRSAFYISAALLPITLTFFIHSVLHGSFDKFLGRNCIMNCSALRGSVKSCSLTLF